VFASLGWTSTRCCTWRVTTIPRGPADPAKPC
jgi:hypothetical protein